MLKCQYSTEILKILSWYIAELDTLYRQKCVTLVWQTAFSKIIEKCNQMLTRNLYGQNSIGIATDVKWTEVLLVK